MIQKNYEERSGFVNWFLSFLLFALIVAVASFWIKNNVLDTSPKKETVATTTAPVVVKEKSLPNVTSPAKIITAEYNKTLYPNGKGFLLEAMGEYPTNTYFASYSEKHVKGFVDGFVAEYPKRTDIVTSAGVSGDSSVTYSHGIKLLSYLYTDYRDEGGAHGNGVYSSETYDMNGKMYSLEDLFMPESNYLSVLSKMAIAHFKNVPDINFDPKDTTFGDGLKPKVANFNTFVISGNNIIFQFQSYQIGPYSDGAPEWQLSLVAPELKNLIRPELFTK